MKGLTTSHDASVQKRYSTPPPNHKQGITTWMEKKSPRLRLTIKMYGDTLMLQASRIKCQGDDFMKKCCQMAKERLQILIVKVQKQTISALSAFCKIFFELAMKSSSALHYEA